jgi:hypothetical protein
MNGKMIGAILSGAFALVVDPGLRRLQKAFGLPEPRQEVTVTEFWMTASLTADFPSWWGLQKEGMVCSG